MAAFNVMVFRPEVKAEFVARWMVKPVSLVALSVQVRLICVELTAVATRFDGAAGSRIQDDLVDRRTRARQVGGVTAVGGCDAVRADRQSGDGEAGSTAAERAAAEARSAVEELDRAGCGSRADRSGEGHVVAEDSTD